MWCIPEGQALPCCVQIQVETLRAEKEALDREMKAGNLADLRSAASRSRVEAGVKVSAAVSCYKGRGRWNIKLMAQVEGQQLFLQAPSRIRRSRMYQSIGGCKQGTVPLI